MSEFETESTTVGSVDPAAARKAQRVVAAMSADAEECRRLLAMLGLHTVAFDSRVGAQNAAGGAA